MNSFDADDVQNAWDELLTEIDRASLHFRVEPTNVSGGVYTRVVRFFYGSLSGGPISAWARMEWGGSDGLSTLFAYPPQVHGAEPRYEYRRWVNGVWQVVEEEEE